MELAEGQPAPDFTLPDETGQSRSLTDYRGQPLVLYFYPEDDTPGCTAEACNFRDDYSVFTDLGIQLVGVSPDDPESHQAFKGKYKLPFPLLADVGHKVSDAYGVWGEKVLFGHHYEGVRRSTFLIDEFGNISKIFTQVHIRTHSRDVLESAKGLLPGAGESVEK